MNWRRQFSLVGVLWLFWLYATPVSFSATYDGSARFSDVLPTSPFNEPIGWAVAKGITDGTSPTTFNPGGPCTVQAILKFLWAYHEKPDYSDEGYNVYEDVKETFRVPANWAYWNGYEIGQTTGEAGDKKHYLSGEEKCTRVRVAWYLWLIAGRPLGYRDYAEPFEDLGHYADFPVEDVVGWAVAMGITNGTSSTTFSPESPCTRGQIVTFLFRYDKSAKSVNEG